MGFSRTIGPRRRAPYQDLRGYARLRVFPAQISWRSDLFAILVDADACPVKDEIYSVSTRHGIDVALVANAPMHVPPGTGVVLIRVGREPDAADDWIAAEARPGDIVVTSDIPLAARCLSVGALVIAPDGRCFSEDSIGDAVATRQLMSELRDMGLASGGPRPLAPRDRVRFLTGLERLVQQAKRATPRRSESERS